LNSAPTSIQVRKFRPKAVKRSCPEDAHWKINHICEGSTCERAAENGASGGCFGRLLHSLINCSELNSLITLMIFYFSTQKRSCAYPLLAATGVSNSNKAIPIAFSYRLSESEQDNRNLPPAHIGRERSGKHWEHCRMRREEAEGQTKYRSEGLCAAKALVCPIDSSPSPRPSDAALSVRG
jgi:hypothetical protein